MIRSAVVIDASLPRVVNTSSMIGLIRYASAADEAPYTTMATAAPAMTVLWGVA